MAVTKNRQESLERTLEMLLRAIEHNAADGHEMLDELWYAQEIATYVKQGYSWESAGKQFLENV